MTNTDNTVLTLIRIAVSGKTENLQKKIDWAEVIEKASIQGVLGLCFDAIDLLSNEHRPDINNLMKWLGQVNYMETCYEEHKKAIINLARFYDKQGIKMMLLKGYGLSLYWPKSNHRPVGDIDSYNFGLHSFADKMISDKLNIKIDNSHHKHSVFSFMGVTVENHYSFLNTHGHRSTADIDKILFEEINEIADPDILNLYYPSVKFNSLYLLRHSAEHFASVDLNLRQVLDWGFFVQKNNIDWNWLLSVLGKVGMKDYFAVLNAICIKHLGFDSSLFPALDINNALVDRSLNDILKPEVEREHHSNLISEVGFRFKRWWKNSWKHDMVYRESKWQSLLTQVWSHILKPSL